MKLIDLRQKRLDFLKSGAEQDEHGWFRLELSPEELLSLHHDQAFKDVELSQMNGCVAYGIRLVVADA